MRTRTAETDHDEIEVTVTSILNTRGKFHWAICSRCDGNAKVDHPAFANGITSTEWDQDWDEESRKNYHGFYDQPCPECRDGKVRVPNMAALTFAEKRVLVTQRRIERWRAESARDDAHVRRMESGGYDH